MFDTAVRLAARYINWAVTEQCYRVQLFERGKEEPLEDYTAGNSSRCSQTYVPPGSRTALSLDEMRRAAGVTIREMAARHHVLAEDINEDPDLPAEPQE